MITVYAYTRKLVALAHFMMMLAKISDAVK